MFGPVASDPTVSRLIDTLATNADTALAALDSARARVRAKTWELTGEHDPDHGIDTDHPLIVDLDATLLDAHSEKQHAAPTFKRGYGFQCAMSLGSAANRLSGPHSGLKAQVRCIGDAQNHGNA